MKQVVVLRIRASSILYILLGALATSTMVNAPGILVGYGLVYAVEYYAILAYPPLTGALLFLTAHLIALPILIYTRSLFLTVAVASLVLRPILVLVIGRVKHRLGAAGAALSLAALEQLFALSAAILIYGDDGMHVGLAIYSLLLAPFTYSIYRFNRIEVNPLAATASIVLLAAYWLSALAFLSIPLLLASIAGLAILYTRLPSVKLSWLAAAAIILAVLGFAAGGAPLAYNARAALYPFNPHSWSSDRWAVQEAGGCHASGNVFQHTHDPSRLRIISQCVTVEGVVKPVPGIASDGDYCFDLEVNDSTLLGIGNIILRRGGLHVEVVPADHYRVLSPVGGGVCPGDVVRVTGVFVIDTDHGRWAEIHPAEQIVVVERANGTWPDCVRGVSFGG